MGVTYYPAGPIDIRDATFDLLVQTGFFKNVYKCRTKPLKTDTQHDLLPSATIWFLEEEAEAMAEGCGVPQFHEILRLAIDIVVAGGSEKSIDKDVTTLVRETKYSLLSNIVWLQHIKGVRSIKTDYAYPRETEDYLARGVINIDVSYDSIWSPEFPDLTGLSLTTPRSGDAEPIYTRIDF